MSDGLTDAGIFENVAREYVCVVCGKKTQNPKTIMHGCMHRYVCSDQCMIEFYKPSNSKSTVLLEAAIMTLKANPHLCDGDNCTLRELRDAVENISPDWDR